MIAIRIQGRLGNQLFQYAFIYAASKKLKTGFYIDQYTDRSVIDKYFQNINEKPLVAGLFNVKGFKNIFSFHLRRSYYKYAALKGKFIHKTYENGVPVADITLQNNTIYEGYFQSVQFFYPYEELIRNKFTLKKNCVTQFNNKYGELYKNNRIVTVHIRRADYQNLQHLNLGANDLSLPLEYYRKAISKYEGQHVHFVFVSDDLDFVSKNFKDITNKTISEDTEIMDFQHLLNADACIISNSTFSWWGAWLNNKPGKVIYAPKYFLGWRIEKETPQGIYADNWILIDV